ncbi:uncharacterized protein LOC117392730 isoform X2 [Periophthalmus magnuspinnatus]|nr:uncharacterized protein LOC117392730 isoform X2 [Periophthalmus magnuspinnatus]
MCKRRTLRALVQERLTAAAEEIFALFERTIAEYEEELRRSKEENQRSLRGPLQTADRDKQLVKPAPDRFHSAALNPGDQMPWLSPGLKQESPETPQVKEEPEEPRVKQEEEQQPV